MRHKQIELETKEIREREMGGTIDKGFKQELELNNKVFFLETSKFYLIFLDHY